MHLSNLTLIEIEALLNTNYAKRYHFRESQYGISVVEILNNSKENILIEDANESYLRIWLERNIKVILDIKE